MSERDSEISAFLANTEWSAAREAPLAGDASNRRYLRLTLPETGSTAVLMDAPPDRGEDIRPFTHIARYLTRLGFSAPRILAEDDAAGFLLLEDLGDALFARVLNTAPEQESSLYSTATDILSELHTHPPPDGLNVYSPDVMTDMAALAFDWYLHAATGAQSTPEPAFKTAMQSVLSVHASRVDVMIQRDYHAENLLWLPERHGTARVGLLDFQDAMLGHRAYDLVSLLQDARRDVHPDTETAMLNRYIRTANRDPDTFKAAYFCLGAQRNLRIIGVFTRLCLRDGKQHYVDLIPRVWALLQRDLSQPCLGPVADVVNQALPEPTPEILTRIKEKCATIPAP